MRPGLSAIIACTAPAFLLAGCYTTSAPPPKVAEQPDVQPMAPADLRALTAPEKVLLAKGFAAGLKDPASAQFQWTKVPKVLPKDAFDYCAVVNAKNSYGGYTGAAPFMGLIMVNNGKIIGGVMGAVGETNPAYSHLLPEMCRKKGLDPYAVSGN